MTRLIAIAVSLGIDEMRFTGGEPLLRTDVVEIVSSVQALPAAPRMSLTTNGIRLPGLAAPLADAGVERVNISLDTLQRDRFIAMTRRDRLVDVMAGVAAAKAAGLRPVKVNTVLMRGVNDDEAVPLLQWAIAEGVHLRFIEQMPLDAQHAWDRTSMVTADEILTTLAQAFALSELPGRGSAPAQEWTVDGGVSTVGIIASVTRPFCADCNRLRLTADGQLRSCLFAREESDLRTPMRAGADDDHIAGLMRLCIAGKKPGHGIDDPEFLQPQRPMSAIGG
jgi:cyclic pyranopterin phosphate synthase